MQSAVATCPRESGPILLVGGSGQLGRELAARLGAVGQLVTTTREPAARGETPTGQPGVFVPLDLTRPGELRDVVRRARPRLIVCAAAFTDVDGAEDDPRTAHAVNTDAPALLAEEALALGATLVHYSTDYVFDGAGDRPWREDDPTRPQNEYGRSKLAGEEAIRASGAAHLILRASWLYSEVGRNFPCAILRRAERCRELAVVDDQIGAPTPAAEVARITLELLRRIGLLDADETSDSAHRARAHHERSKPERPDPPRETLHVACRGEVSRYDWARAIIEDARAQGVALAVERVVPVATRDFPTRATRPLNSRLDLSRLIQRFGVEPRPWRLASARDSW